MWGDPSRFELIDRTDVEEGALITVSFYVVVLNLPRYLEQAEADAAVSYLANALGPIAQVRKLQELAAEDRRDLRNLIQLNLDIDDVAAWARGNEARLAELRTITEERAQKRATSGLRSKLSNRQRVPTPR